MSWHQAMVRGAPERFLRMSLAQRLAAGSGRAATNAAVTGRAAAAARAAAAVAAAPPQGGLARLSRWPPSGGARCASVAMLRMGAAAMPPPPAVSSGPPPGIGRPPPSGGGGATSPPPKGRLWRAAVLLVKGVGLWAPALFFWMSLVWGMPLVHLRTDDEIQDEENEVRRLERFFDVEGLPEFEYLAEWAAKEEALAGVVEKLLRSPRFAEAFLLGPDDLDAEHDQDPPRSRRGSLSAAEADNLAALVEVSYVLPPPAQDDGGTLNDSLGTGGTQPWMPRLIFAHRGGALALVAMVLEHVEKGKDREERWTCTELRSELIATRGGEALGEPICDLKGPLPHGVRYMRIA
eukprot:CAMPEP_0117530092 /NCGR_PEP_ID=MMETSP0784-20121206/38165_1 /TAXON_ID=39447 /ORGANISM="" /LENGTH=348 /DNA_ID=CAMNT_0005326425 /DNA_START=9 /DNA_END=1055 /DNA_ORIENTATION=-